MIDMENENYYSSLLCGTDNDCEMKSKNRYDKIIDSVNGTIGIINKYDSDYGAYCEVYLDDKYACDADIYCTDKEIEDLVEDALFKIDTTSDEEYPF